MIKVIIASVEWALSILILIVSWGSLPGYIMSLCGTWYFVAMIKKNVVDEKYNGSWLQYFKSKLKLK